MAAHFNLVAVVQVVRLVLAPLLLQVEQAQQEHALAVVWAVAARDVLRERRETNRIVQSEEELQRDADKFLRQHGYGQLARRH